MRNLLENAVKYSPQCRTVWVEGALNQRQVMISVRDRGIGIEPREQREIFQNFVRGMAAKKAGIKGTGIGLSMVRQIIDACGGQIRLQSAAGAGSNRDRSVPRPAMRPVSEPSSDIASAKAIRPARSFGSFRPDGRKRARTRSPARCANFARRPDFARDECI